MSRTQYDDAETVYTAEELARMRNGIITEHERQDMTKAEKDTKKVFDDLNGLFAEKTGNIYIYRDNGAGGGSGEYLEKFPSDKFPEKEMLLEFIRSKYGSGDFRIQGRLQGERGIKVNSLLTIGKTLAEEKEEKEKHLPAVISGDKDDRVLMVLLQQQQETRELIKAMQENRAKPGAFDRLLTLMQNPEILAIIIPAVTAGISGFMNRPKNDPIAQLTNLMKVQQMMKDNSDEKPDVDNAASGLGVLGQLAIGVLSNMGKNGPPAQSGEPAPVDRPSMAAVATANQNKAAQPPEDELWSADDVADHIEYILESRDITQQDVVDCFAKTGNNTRAIKEALVYISDEAFTKIETSARTLFGIDAPTIELMKKAREEYANQIIETEAENNAENDGSGNGETS